MMRQTLNGLAVLFQGDVNIAFGIEKHCQAKFGDQGTIFLKQRCKLCRGHGVRVFLRPFLAKSPKSKVSGNNPASQLERTNVQIGAAQIEVLSESAARPSYQIGAA